MSFNEALNEVAKREEMNRGRYLKVCGIDVNDLSIFNIVLDAAHLEINETLNLLKIHKLRH